MEIISIFILFIGAKRTLMGRIFDSNKFYLIHIKRLFKSKGHIF